MRWSWAPSLGPGRQGLGPRDLSTLDSHPRRLLRPLQLAAFPRRGGMEMEIVVVGLQVLYRRRYKGLGACCCVLNLPFGGDVRSRMDE